MPIDPLTSTASALTTAASPTPDTSDTSGTSGAASGFGAALHDLLSAVDSTNTAANQSVANMLDGTGDVHDAMIALQQADMTFQLAVQIRNKFIDAYQDVMRMPT